MDTEYFVVFKEMNFKDDFKIKIVLNIEVMENSFQIFLRSMYFGGFQIHLPVGFTVSFILLLS